MILYINLYVMEFRLHKFVFKKKIINFFKKNVI